MKKIPAILTALILALGFEGMEANADGLLSEADFFSLFDRAADAYDALEETYAQPEAA